MYQFKQFILVIHINFQNSIKSIHNQNFLSSIHHIYANNTMVMKDDHIHILDGIIKTLYLHMELQWYISKKTTWPKFEVAC